MPILNLFSKRQDRVRGEVPDVYTYDELPKAFRVQFVHIAQDLLGRPEQYYHGETSRGPGAAYKFITESLCREYGVFRLHDKDYGAREYPHELFNFFLAAEVERALDVVELVARYADLLTRDYTYLTLLWES